MLCYVWKDKIYSEYHEKHLNVCITSLNLTKAFGGSWLIYGEFSLNIHQIFENLSHGLLNALVKMSSVIYNLHLFKYLGKEFCSYCTYHTLQFKSAQKCWMRLTSGNYVRHWRSWNGCDANHSYTIFAHVLGIIIILEDQTTWTHNCNSV